MNNQINMSINDVESIPEFEVQEVIKCFWICGLELNRLEGNEFHNPHINRSVNKWNFG